MGPSRRFLNLIVGSSLIPRAKSLRCIDLMRHRFFDTPPPPQPPPPVADASNWKDKQAEETVLKMERIQLPDPFFNFRASTMSNQWVVDCFPLAGREVLCADQSGCTFLFDGDTRDVVTMPDLQPKLSPISIFVPSAGLDKHDGCGGSLFIMENLPKPEARCSGQESDQFEALVYDKVAGTSFCQLLPPPPFVRDPKYWHSHPNITAYAVVGGGSHICISVEGIGRIGTYCLDTLNHKWSQAGEWTLPFHGKVEYVPELNLWFGISAKTQQLAAADLSTMDSQPELIKAWKELKPPKEWWDSQESQLVNLGGGRFCIARFFHNRIPTGIYDDQITEDHFAVLTSVQVVLCDQSGNGCGNVDGGNGKVDLRMIKHESTIHVSSGSRMIKSVF